MNTGFGLRAFGDVVGPRDLQDFEQILNISRLLSALRVALLSGERSRLRCFFIYLVITFGVIPVFGEVPSARR